MNDPVSSCGGGVGPASRGGRPDTPSAGIRATALGFSWGEQPVLEGVDLECGAGRVVGYVGVNGSGKTTTLRILAGLLDGYAGRVEVAGHDLRAARTEAKACIGYVPEGGVLYETLTLAETLLLFGRLHGLEDGVVRERGEALLEAFELEERLGQRVGALSRGMRQKTLLVLALLHDPAVLLLDEPFTGLDVSSRSVVGGLLRGLAERGRTVLISSHALDMIEELCDEVAILHRTRIVARGSLASLSAQLEGSSLRDLLQSLREPEDADEELRVRRALGALGP